MLWFKHDADANRDPKLEKVLMRYGAEGYALYWLCLEFIAAPISRTNITFELEHDAEILAHRLKMDSVRVEEIMKYMVSLNLFEFDATTQRVTCLKLASRLENSIIKNPQLKQIQQVIRKDPGLSGTIPDISGKVRPEKRREDIDTDIDKKKDGVPPSLNEKAWMDYLQHRRDLKAKRLTERGLQMAMTKLAELPHGEQLATVELSISNGWTGLFPEKRKAVQVDAEDPYIANLRRAGKCSLQTT